MDWRSGPGPLGSRGGDSSRGYGAYRGRGRGISQPYRGRGRGGVSNPNRVSNESQTSDRQTRPMGQKIDRLADGNTPSDELLQALTGDGAFYAALNVTEKPNYERRRNILTVLSRAAQFNVSHFRQTLHNLLQTAVESKFFTDWLPNDVSQLSFNFAPFSDCTAKEKEDFTGEICLLIIEILDKLPGVAAKISILITSVFSVLNSNILLTDNPDSDLQIAARRLKIIWEDVVEKKQKQDREDTSQGHNERFTPYGDFRNLPPYPRQEDILQFNKPALRKNIIKGRYQDVDHYLDVQFRLLREDFIGPLRESVKLLAEQQRGADGRPILAGSGGTRGFSGKQEIDYVHKFVTWFGVQFHPTKFAVASSILFQLFEHFGGPMESDQDFVAFKKQARIWDKELCAVIAGKVSKEPHYPFGIVGLKPPVLDPNRPRGVPSTRCFQCQGRGHRSLHCNEPCWKCGLSHKSIFCAVVKCKVCLQIGHEDGGKMPCPNRTRSQKGIF